MALATALVGEFCQVQAQTEFRKKEQRMTVTGGVILETNVSGFFHSGINNGQSRVKVGGTVGGFVDLGISDSFSVQGEMLFHYKHSEFEWGSVPGKFSYRGLEVPLYAMYHIRFKGDRQLYLGAGPYTEFGLEATYRYNGMKSDLYEKDGRDGQPVMRDSNTGFGLKIGYEFSSGLQLNVSYKASFTNMLNVDNVKLCPHAASIGLAYRFGR